MPPSASRSSRTSAQAAPAESPRCPINVAARRSGLSAHVIRAWERRYEAIKPDRTDKSRRLYSDWEVQRLVLLRQAVELGHRISEIANLPMEELRALVGRDTLPGVEASPKIPFTRSKLVEVALEAARAMDGNAFQQALLQATRSLTIPDLFSEFVDPLMQDIGRRWREGDLRIAHEHFASAQMRTFLGDLMTSSSVAPSGPMIVVTTPFGQNHELGALMVAVTALRAGWAVQYLGPGLPAEEIVYAAEQLRARAVALSLCYPADDPRIEGQLLKLRAQLPMPFPLFIGGSSSSGYGRALAQIGARRPSGLREFSLELDALRRERVAGF
ncbi:MAG TPA: MerR family transcriptional regulator [Nevskiaceae bacterium]|nr:MerR family transcriptional regulator [Nevskiaceae bacterium]